MKNLILNQSILKTKFLTGISFLFLLLNLTILSGCLDSNYVSSFADSSSNEAKYHEGQMALDDANYAKAVAVLTPLIAGLAETDPMKDKARALLASAKVGVAGFDTLDLMDSMMSEDAPETDPEDLIGVLLGDADGNVTAESISETVENLEDAIAALSSITDRTDDQNSQLATFSAYHMMAEVTNVAVAILGEPLDLSNIEDITPGQINETIITSNGYSETEIANDINSMTDLPDDSPFKEPFDELLDGIDPDDNGVTADEIATWIANMGS